MIMYTVTTDCFANLKGGRVMSISKQLYLSVICGIQDTGNTDPIEQGFNYSMHT